jgi:thiamine-phosphate pyrophosphorylase
MAATMKPLRECQLYTFVDFAYLRGRDPVTVTRQLCDGGSDLIQLRAKGSSVDKIRETAAKLAPITAKAGVGLVINDHLSIALEVGAPFCHLGQEDFFDNGYKHVEEILQGNKATQIGLSSHAPDQAKRAVAAGAAYVAIGPVFATGTKPKARPVTLEYVRWAAANLTVPWFAIGGINLSNIGSVIEAGAQGVCVVSGILNCEDIATACLEFKKRLP